MPETLRMMGRRPCRPSLLVHCFIILAQVFLAQADDTTNKVDHPTCRLFLAESTIPGAGLGIFTGIDLQPNEAVAEPDIIVPLHDQVWHAGEDMDFWILWNEYSWHIAQVGMQYDMEQGSALVIGTGCMPNCNFAMINAKEGMPDYDQAGLHRSKDVGVSGFTGYYNQRMLTLRDIPAGGEIFVSYGEQWFQTRMDYTGPIPFVGNYENVDKFLKPFRKISLKYHQAANDPEFTRDLWDVIMSFPYETQNSKALPISFEDMQSAQSIGSAETRLPYSVRTLEWLNEHGRCMDNIRPGNSTIKQAGRGAFASRKIPKGGLVAPGPLLHIPNRTALNVYEQGSDGNRDRSKLVGMQLILNYCFGHSESSVILCPYTSPSAYINHNSESPNAKIVWSENSTHNHNPEWLEEKVDFLKGCFTECDSDGAKTEGIGLSIEFVATRDIEPGEEVFIDYGPEWEAAWNEYAKNWSPPADSDKYVPASTITEPLRTAVEEEEQPYPKNIAFYCPFDYEPDLGEETWEWQDAWIDLPTYPCEVTSRKVEVEVDTEGNTQYYYDVIMLDVTEIEQGMTIMAQSLIPEGEEHIILNMPGRAIQVTDKKYTKDEYVKNSFRHEMMIPDDIFPPAWKNLRKY